MGEVQRSSRAPPGSELFTDQAAQFKRNECGKQVARCMVRAGRAGAQKLVARARFSEELPYAQVRALEFWHFCRQRFFPGRYAQGFKDVPRLCGKRGAKA